MSGPRRADRAPMWAVWMAGAVAVVVALAGGTLALGWYLWQAETRVIAGQMASARRVPSAVRVDLARAGGLPAPVLRYLAAVLTDGQAVVAAARFTQQGEFLIEPGRWVPFVATHEVLAAPPAFDWDARMRVAPGVDVFVRDAYVQGEGRLRAAVLGLWTVADAEPSPALAEGELLRYLAEAVWYPTVLLPGGGLTWEPVDGTTARARLTDGAVSVALDFRFGDDGLVREVETADRPRLVDGQSVRTRWRGRFAGYTERAGMRVPASAEVEWVLPEGPQPYWRGQMTGAEYELAR